MPRGPRTEEIKKETGERLRLAREALGIQAKDLAELVSVAGNTWSSWESGTNLLDPYKAVQLFHTHGISLDWLYCGRLGSLPEDLAEKIRASMATAAHRSQTKPAKRTRPLRAAG
jgi:transcriptional regulator with XRE-family HTH domain